MTFTVDFKFETISELHNFLSANKLIQEETAPTPTSPLAEFLTGEQTAPAANAKTVKRRGRPPEPKEEVLPEGEKMPAFINKPVVETPALKVEILDYKYVAQATADAVRLAGREKVVNLLGEYGVTIAKDLKDTDRAEYVKKCGELIKTASPTTSDELA